MSGRPGPWPATLVSYVASPFQVQQQVIPANGYSPLFVDCGEKVMSTVDLMCRSCSLSYCMIGLACALCMFCPKFCCLHITQISQVVYKKILAVRSTCSQTAPYNNQTIMATCWKFYSPVYLHVPVEVFAEHNKVLCFPIAREIPGHNLSASLISNISHVYAVCVLSVPPVQGTWKDVCNWQTGLSEDPWRL